MSNDVQLRDVIEGDIPIPIFFQQQLDPEAAQMAAFPSRDKDAFMAHWNKIMADDSILIKTILFYGDVAGNIVCFEQLGERLEKCGFTVSGEDKFFSQILGEDIEEYILILDASST